MTSLWVKGALIGALTLLTGCIDLRFGSGTGPEPTPPPDYKVVCRSTPFLFNDFITDCTPVERPVIERRAVIRTKG